MDSVLFGIVQGLAEFLPVSSSGHLFVLQYLLKIKDDILPFFVFLHIATLAAMLIFFWPRIKRVYGDKKNFMPVVTVTFVTGAGALLIKKFLEGMFTNPFFLMAGFLVNAVILLGAIKPPQDRRTVADFTVKDAIYLGLAQAAAVLPAISRSGTTIVMLLRRGFKSEEAFNISFLLSMPVIVLAFLVEAGDIARLHMSAAYLAAGFITAFISGLAALKLLEKIVAKGKFQYFSIYCFCMFLTMIFLTGR